MRNPETLDERIAHHEAELARLRAERAKWPERLWVWEASDGRRHAYTRPAPACVEYVCADKVRVEPAPFVVTDSVVRVMWLWANGEEVSLNDRKSLALRLSTAGIPAVAEGAQP